MFRRSQHAFPSSVFLFAFLLVGCSGGGGGASQSAPPPTFTVDQGTQPQAATIAGIDGGEPRALGSVVDEKGRQADFVLNELVVSTDDTAALNALVTRWSGTVLKTVDFATAGLTGVPKLHVVRVNASSADTARLAEDLRALDPNARGAHRFSSEDGLKLLAAGANEAARHGMAVSLNWVLKPGGIVEGATWEAPLGEASYDLDAFSWPYMNRGSAQDIGVGAAWQALAATGKLSNQVKIMVMDGGFELNNGDFPIDRSIYAGAWSTPNPGACSGGSSCPWHGTSVVNAAMGLPDNSFGTAGPAGPVARMVAVQSPSEDLFEYLDYVASTLAALILEQPRIINISAGTSVPAVPALLLDAVVSPITAGLRGAGILIFASAGNDAANVDEEDCFFGCWEEAYWVPCESAAVICVGGMRWDAAAREVYPTVDGGEAGSNWGTRADAGSVDMYGPFTIWGGPDPGHPDNSARKIHGTSYSSPFVAGVAALVWAADPTLSANQVWDVMRNTAHVGGVDDGTGNQHRINAFGAVQQVLGGDVPPFVRIDEPGALPLAWRAPVRFSATTYDVDGVAPTVSWNSSRIGNFGPGGSVFTFSFDDVAAVGAHVITATASSGGQTGTDSVNITIVNGSPMATILAPANGASVCTGEAVSFQVSVADTNNPAAFPFPASGVSWAYSGAASGSFGSGSFTPSRVFSVAGSYTITVSAADELSATDTDSVGLTVASCADSPPSVSITSPTDAPGTPDLEVSVGGSGYASVTLTGSGSDVEDGTLTGTSLVWQSDKGDVQPGGPTSGAQQLGTGTSLGAQLYSSCSLSYSGTVDHVITLTATDSAGNARTVTRVIRVKTLC